MISIKPNNGMKKFAFLSILSILFLSNVSLAQVGIGTTTPDNSAALDVQSNGKGILAPRMTTGQRLLISSPAEGLLVYDTDTHSFWYFHDAAWRELFRSESNGAFLFGLPPDYMAVEPDGTLVFYGSGTTFNDLQVPTNAAKAGGNSPDWEKFRDNGSGSPGVYVWTFANNGANAEDEIHFTLQVPHDYKIGSDIYPHVHWAPMTAGSGAVTWGMEYTWVDINGTFSPTGIVTATSDPLSANQYKHIVTTFGPITPSASQDYISSILCIRLFRNSSNAGDTYAGNAALLSFDIHYEADTQGSRTEFIK
jgi:hypothetical protein